MRETLWVAGVALLCVFVHYRATARAYASAVREHAVREADRYDVVREAAVEAARVFQGDIALASDPARRFWDQFREAFPDLDTNDLPPRPRDLVRRHA